MNLDGKVVGINTAVAAGASGLGFAIPLSQKEIDYLLGSIQKYGTIKRPYLGVRYVSLDENLARANHSPADAGALISDGGVIAGSPAEKAGLKPGDVIIEIAGKQLKNTVTLRDALVGRYPGETVTLRVLKKETGTIESVRILLGEI